MIDFGCDSHKDVLAGVSKIRRFEFSRFGAETGLDESSALISALVASALCESSYGN
jgi:hypothetical protein